MIPRALTPTLILTPLLAASGCQQLLDLAEDGLESGEAIEFSSGCSSELTTLVNALDGWFGVQTAMSSSCGTHTREVSTGVTLGPSPDGSDDWNNLGGRGALMADAGLCLLADLGRLGEEGYRPPGASVGPFSVSQRLGQTFFDAEGRHWEGYQTIDVCAPLLDCFEVQRQTLVADVMSTPLEGWVAGAYPQEESYSLRFTSQPSDIDFSVALETITVPTPLGPISFSPSFVFGSTLETIDAPFPHPLTARHAFFLGNTQPLQELNGRTGTPFVVQVNPDSDEVRGGWVSQLGFGQRDGREDATLWAPQGGTALEPDVRPDFDYGEYLVDNPGFDGTQVTMAQPRTSDEATPVASIELSADIGYDLAAVLPDELLVWPLEIEEASLVLHPFANAVFAAQTQFVAREGDPILNEFSEQSVTQVLSQPATAAAGEAGITVELHLVLAIDVGPFAGPKVEIHRSFVVPMFGGADSDYRAGGLAWAESRSLPEDAPELSQVHAWSGYGDEADFLLECLEDEPYVGDVPPPVREDGSDGLFDVTVCNLCVFRIGYPSDGFDVPTLPLTIFGFGTPQWDCTPDTNGCTDLCRFDTETGAFVEIVESAAENAALCEGPVPE